MVVIEVIFYGKRWKVFGEIDDDVGSRRKVIDGDLSYCGNFF